MVTVDLGIFILVSISAILAICWGINLLKTSFLNKESEETKRNITKKPGQMFYNFYGLMQIVAGLIVLVMMLVLYLRGMLVIMP